MLSAKKIKKENNESKKSFVGFCKESYKSVVDGKNLHIFNCLFEKGINLFI